MAEGVSNDAHAALVATQELLTAVMVEREEAEAQRSTRETELSAARRHYERLQSEERELDDLAHRQELALAEQRLRSMILA